MSQNWSLTSLPVNKPFSECSNPLASTLIGDICLRPICCDSGDDSTHDFFQSWLMLTNLFEKWWTEVLWKNFLTTYLPPYGFQYWLVLLKFLCQNILFFGVHPLIIPWKRWRSKWGQFLFEKLDEHEHIVYKWLDLFKMYSINWTSIFSYWIFHLLTDFST